MTIGLRTLPTGPCGARGHDRRRALTRLLHPEVRRAVYRGGRGTILSGSATGRRPVLTRRSTRRRAELSRRRSTGRRTACGGHRAAARLAGRPTRRRPTRRRPAGRRPELTGRRSTRRRPTRRRPTGRRAELTGRRSTGRRSTGRRSTGRRSETTAGCGGRRRGAEASRAGSCSLWASGRKRCAGQRARLRGHRAAERIHVTGWRRCRGRSSGSGRRRAAWRRWCGRCGRAGRGRRDTEHRALELRLGCGRRGRRSGRGRCAARSRSTTSAWAWNVRRRVHHQHRALELGGRRALQVEAALCASRAVIRILRPTVRAKHSSPPVPARGSGAEGRQPTRARTSSQGYRDALSPAAGGLCSVTRQAFRTAGR